MNKTPPSSISATSMKVSTQKYFIAMTLTFSLNSQALEIFEHISNHNIFKNISQVICLAGGGEKEDWKGAWTQMLKANKGGDLVIIRARSGPGEGIQFITELLKSTPKIIKPNSFTTISFARREEVDQPRILEYIRNAEVIFFDGGDQYLYLQYFKNTQFAKEVNKAIHERKVIIGGTSAGMALLGGVDYTAKYGSPTDGESMVTSHDALNNPLGEFLDLDDSLFVPPYLEGVITETHFSERNRQGRIVGLMARNYHNNLKPIKSEGSQTTPLPKPVKAIAADEFVSVCYKEDGIARVYGLGKAFFLQSNGPIEQIMDGKPLHWYADGKAVSVYAVDASPHGAGEFNLKTWSGQGGDQQYWWVKGKKRKVVILGTSQ